MRRREGPRRPEELRNRELQRRKRIEMRREEERRRREEEMTMRHREREDPRRRPDGFKPNYPDNREQEMRAGERGPGGAINMGCKNRMK
ncbi:paraspeckle component 1-like [Seriola lalandi dorsalis]|uniref:paraspeckle component 1-like n=1 Tax=Seriola lalandi dorsalis TaxID=1841481 RepID=UPI000C6FC240|nr:paraspeckle component 1-like [Seriola lalandi dorsalis]XP_023282743.1 paraspeckle component 1-like [Seriola lalandi dorsalis]XP_023282744.1 paraspeckle component 1-like [Seriola lalandi dorsalis]